MIIQLSETQKRLWRPSLEAGASQEAWTFVVQQDWNLDLIREQLADKEDFRARPSIQNSQMTPSASPRIFTDVYIETLKEAIAIIEVQEAAIKAHAANPANARK